MRANGRNVAHGVWMQGMGRETFHWGGGETTQSGQELSFEGTYWAFEERGDLGRCGDVLERRSYG